MAEAMVRTLPRSRRILSRIAQIALAPAVLAVLGFVWFVMALPGPANDQTATDGIAVLTGGPGRMPRAIAVLEAGKARRLLVSGVDSRVRPAEFIAVTGISARLFDCCVDLGYASDSTRSNASEVAEWVKEHQFRSIRLVTAGYHMPRAEAEIRARVARDVLILPDAVSGERTLAQMALEYAKFVAARVTLLVHRTPA